MEKKEYEELRLDIVAASLAPPRRDEHQAKLGEQTVAILRSAALLRSRSNLYFVLERALPAVAPSCFLPEMLAKMKSESKPWGAAQVSRSHLLVDAAFINVLRDTGDFQNASVYFWADARLQGSFDWLNLVFSYVKDDEFYEIHSSMHWLEASQDGSDRDRNSQRDLLDPDGHSLLRAAQERSEKGRSLLRNVKRHCPCQVPVALGSRMSSLAHNVRGICHGSYLEQASRAAMRLFMLGICSFTVDSGTEADISNFRSMDFTRVLPPWQTSGDLEADAGLDVEPLDAEDNVENHLKFLLPKAIVVAGMMHICDNMTKDMQVVLVYWTTWLKGLQILQSLFCKTRSSERFLKKCILSRECFERFAWLFESDMPTTIDWRWGAVVKVLRSLLLEKERVFRAAWDATLFKADDDEERRNAAIAAGLARRRANRQEPGQTQDASQQPSPGKERLDPKAVTATVLNAKWWCYSRMLLSLHSLPNYLSGWAETCPCHMLRQAPSPQAGQVAIMKDLGFDASTRKHAVVREGFNCPGKGNNAPDCAAGRPLLDEAAEATVLELQKDFCMDLKDESDAQEMFADFERGNVKLQFWMMLPWILCGLAHRDPTKRVECAKKAVKIYDAAADEDLQHRVAHMFWKVGTLLREQIELLIQGVDLLHEKLKQLRRAVHRLGLIPVVQMVIGATYSIIHKSVMSRHIGRSCVSWAHWLKELEYCIDKCDGFLSRLCSALGSLKKGKFLVEFLRCKDHPDHPGPDVRAVLSSPSLAGISNWHHLIVVLGRIVCSCDLESQLLMHSDNIKKHELGKKEQLRPVVKKLSHEKKSLTADAVLQHAAVHDHFRQVCRPGELYSIPMRPTPGQSLPDLKRLDDVLVTPKVTAIGSQATHVAHALQTKDVSQEKHWVDVGAPASSCSTRPVEGNSKEVESNGRTLSDILYFQVRDTKGSRARTLPIAAGAGRCLIKGQLVVTLNRKLTGAGDGDAAVNVVSVMPARAVGTSDPVYVLSDLGLNLGQLRTELLAWQASYAGLSYSCPGLEADREITGLLTRMLAARGLEGSDAKRVHMTADSNAAERKHLQMLASRNVVECVGRQAGSTSWIITRQGMREMDGGQTFQFQCAICSLPPDGTPLQDMTVYQLMLVMKRQGWQWKRLTPKMKEIKVMYVPGLEPPSPAVWYTAGLVVKREYLLALLQADELEVDRQHGILHGQSTGYYKNILRDEMAIVPHPMSSQDIEPDTFGNVELQDEPAPSGLPLRIIDGHRGRSIQTFEQVHS